MKKYPFILFLLAGIIVLNTTNAQDAASLYDQGLLLKKQKSTALAAVKFKEALDLKPDYTEARYEYGWCQNDLKNYDEAIINLRKVRPAWSQVAKVHFELGYAFDKTGQTDSAKQSYKKCLEINPTYSLAHKQLGYIAYNNNDNLSALDYFKKYEAAVKDSITDYLYWYRKGFVYNANKDYTNAIEALEKSLRYKPDYINTPLELGFANSKLKKDEEAIAHYRKAIVLDPKSYIPYNGIGEVYRDNKKDMNEAMNWYKKTLAIKPDERKACFGMGYCLNNTGKYYDAIAYLRKAIEMESTYTAAYVELGYSYYMTSQNDIAIQNLNKAISQNPLNENSRYYLGLIYINQKDKTKAQQMADELKKLSSKNAESLQAKVNAL